MAKKQDADSLTKVERPFPRRTIEDAMRIPRAIREKNGGEPWSPDQIAAAVGVGAKTGGFYYLTAASRDYGFTEGSSRTESIKLTPLGRKAVYPEEPTDEAEALQTALFSVDKFKSVLEHYKGLNLPEDKFLKNTLQQTFNLDPQVHDEFVDILKKNCRFLGIGSSLEGSLQDAGRTIEQKGPRSNGSVVRELTPSKLGDDRPVCFVIMPFTERDDAHPPGFFDEVLRSLLMPAAEAAGFTVRTANRSGSDVIQSTIVNELLEADLVLADLTEHNPNVLFELGLRMAEDKPVTLVRAKGTGQIFDVDNMLRVVDYDPNIWPSTVDKDVPKITRHVKATWDNRDSAITYMSLLRQSSPVTYLAVSP